MNKTKEQLRDELLKMLHLDDETERNEGVTTVIDHMFDYFDSNTLSGFVDHIAEEYGYDDDVEDEEDIEDEDEEGEDAEY